MNKCGECTMCCELPQVKEFNKPEYQMCRFCDGSQCLIYADRPDECARFDCSWLQSGSPHVDLRPDKCGIMFEKLGDDIFHGMIRPDTELSAIAKGQIDSFIKQGFSVFIKDGNKYIKFLGKDHDGDEMIEEFNKQVEILNGSTIIHN